MIEAVKAVIMTLARAVQKEQELREYNRVAKLRERLREKLGRDPTDEELLKPRPERRYKLDLEKLRALRNRECPNCKGTGRISFSRCLVCKGTGIKKMTIVEIYKTRKFKGPDGRPVSTTTIQKALRRIKERDRLKTNGQTAAVAQAGSQAVPGSEPADAWDAAPAAQTVPQGSSEVSEPRPSWSEY